MEPDLRYAFIADQVSPGGLNDHLSYKMLQINELHFTYLHAQESLLKLEDKKRLENQIREYLMIAPHEKKFVYHETAAVLHRSAQMKENFSGVKASRAWSAIASFAHNLLAQSWRKEFRLIQTHSGFYKHNIENGLIEAEVMLDLMGYRQFHEGIFALEGPVDPDRVAEVSRDSLFAMVECQVLCSLYSDLLKSGCEYTWLDILEYRETHPCNMEQALCGLVYQFNQRYLMNTCRIDCYPKCGFVDMSMYNLPPYRLPNIIPAPSYDNPNALMSYAGNAYNNVPCTSCFKDYNPPSSLNTQPVPFSVPTAQLIELDPPTNRESYDPEDHKRPPLDSHSATVNTGDGNSSQLKYKPNRDTGWDMWMSPYPSETKIKPESSVEQKEFDCFEEAFRALSTDDTTDHNDLSDLGLEKNSKKKSKQESNTVVPGSFSTLGREPPKKTDVNYLSLKVRLSNKRWQCQTCTFNNENDADICAMCYKSKKTGNEVQPLMSGGRQCPKCTLVNEKGVTKCEACGENLKDSPTYI